MDVYETVRSSAEANYSNYFALFELILLAIIGGVLVAFITQTFRKYRKSHIVAQISNTSLLLTRIIDGTKLINARSGKTPSGMYYSYIVSMGSVYSPRKTYGLYHVELPFYAKAHVLGLSKKQNNIESINLKDSITEPLELEGDYPNYFIAYTERGQQSDSRYVMDPKAMVFTVDFCQEYNWEILGGDLYFHCDTTVPSFELIDKFVSEIRPSIASSEPLMRSAHELPYVLHYPRSMNCPICHESMSAGDKAMYCKNHHGSLLNGRQLLQIRRNADAKKLYTLLSFKKKAGEQERELVCPYCQSQMLRSRFQLSELWIDICKKCRFRWVDKYEFEEILGLNENKLDSPRNV